jgi:hypothetical protein
VRQLSLAPRSFTTACGGLFLFVPGLVALDLEPLAQAARLPGSDMIPASHALRSMLALKLWSIEHRSHVMPSVADEGLGLLAGLNVIPKRSFLSEYSSRVDHKQITQLLASYHKRIAGQKLFEGDSFNLDSATRSPTTASTRAWSATSSRCAVADRRACSRFSPRMSTDGRSATPTPICARAQESEEIFQFIDFWKRTHGTLPRHLVFDSKLTTQANLVRLDEMGITFMTLCARSPSLVREIALVPPSAWRQVELDVPTRKFRFPSVHDTKVQIAGGEFRQFVIKDLGHEQPTVLVTNDRKTSAAKVITRYARRMLIENGLSDAVRFFHMNALSSTVGIKVDFDMALLVIASGLYRLLARKMRGYADAHADRIFRDLIDMPATVTVAADQVTVRFHRRAHLPIIIDSGMLDRPVSVPWWNGAALRLTA